MIKLLDFKYKCNIIAPSAHDFSLFVNALSVNQATLPYFIFYSYHIHNSIGMQDLFCIQMLLSTFITIMNEGTLIKTC